MKYLIAFLLCCIVSMHSSAKDKQEFYEIRVYHLQNQEQENRVDKYLKDALLPALHRQGFERVGVFKPVGNDTSTKKRVYVLIPFKKLEHFITLERDLLKDKTYLVKGSDYINTAYNNPAYARIESILLQAFEGMPLGSKPGLKSPFTERIYELRSYESASEKIYANKVEMFNKGDEIGIFKKLGFNAVFYGEVLAGSTKPNLMYMTSFENKEERDNHWKAFGNDPAWKALSSKPEYQHNVSKQVILFLQATDYSDL